VSKRSGTRPSARAKAPAAKRGSAGLDEKTQTTSVGARSFNRRSREAEPRVRSRSTRRTGRSPASLLSLPDYRAVLRSIPRAAWICALIACLNAVCWSIVTPPFEVPDEPDHFAYVKQLAETGSEPSSASEVVSPEENATLRALDYINVRQQPQNPTITSNSEQHALERVGSSTIGESRGSPKAGSATGQPPLYYALEAIPYAIAEHGTVLDRLELMRLLSALMAGLTALFVFLFVREALPAVPWAWTVGGLGVAFAPLLGFISGAVNPDALLFAVSAATFYCLACAFRRGLTTHIAGALGALLIIGLLTKLNFVGLVPGVLLGLLLLSIRSARTSGRAALRPAALALGIGIGPALLFALVNALSGHSLLGPVSGALRTNGRSLLGLANYTWQLYLPRLPGTANDFPGLFTTKQLWFNGYVGLYGWLDTTFPEWVYTAALIPAGAIALLCGRELYTSRSTLRQRAPELIVYATITLGVMAMVAKVSYSGFPEIDAEYAEVRYMLPMLALLGATLALAARGAGKRWGPIVGTLIVVLFIAHDIFSQLLVISRFYG
jgi:hypothetical protein